MTSFAINFNRPHHQMIAKALSNFNVPYLTNHRILFGGGTRIALELDEFRESVDVDFLCIDNEAYRAVRKTVTNGTLGDLVQQDFDYIRDIRADRDGVRCFIDVNGCKIKLEFVRFVDYPLTMASEKPFGVPMIDHASCFLTKLLANADRYADPPYKDIFDLLAMTYAWGDIPKLSWQQASDIYSEKIVKKGLVHALTAVSNSPDKYQTIAVEKLDIEPIIAKQLIEVQCLKILKFINNLE